MSLLGAAWLRRVGLAIRTANPDLYAKLNAARKALIVRGHDVEAYQLEAVESFQRRFPIAGKRILEVGADSGMRVMRMLRGWGASEVIGINPSRTIWDGQPTKEIRLDDSVRLLDAGACQIPFDDASFHAVFSVATFEHIIGLDKALAEMRRVLRPGGVIFSSFGPLWSAGKGHHVNAHAEGIEVHHHDPATNPLPDFSHLLLGREEMRLSLDKIVHPSIVGPIVEWVFECSEINRLFHYQYMAEFAASGLRLLSVHPQCDPVASQVRRILAFRYPAEQHFEVTNLEVMLGR
ncbi:MAG: class I SAM-dependent methyltransferase [Pseudomonadota bacterium]